MKRFILACIVMLGMGAAQAADLSSMKDTPSTASNIWVGPYIGVNVGGVFDYHDVSSAGGHISLGSSGWTASVIGGWDFTYSRFVFGPWVSGAVEQSSTKVFGKNVNAQDNWAVGGRAGYLVGANLLAYGRVGYTVENYDSNVTKSKLNALQGITYGGGLEYAVAPGWFLHTEYRRSDYEGSPVFTTAHDVATDNRILGGVTLKFNNSANPLNFSTGSGYTPLK
jgi:opacity protein-like surface antigen